LCYSFHNFNNVKERNSFLVDAIRPESTAAQGIGNTDAIAGGSSSSNSSGGYGKGAQLAHVEGEEEAEQEAEDEFDIEKASGSGINTGTSTRSSTSSSSSSSISSTSSSTGATTSTVNGDNRGESTVASSATDVAKPHRQSSYIEHMRSSWWYVYNPTYWVVQRFRGLRNTYMSCIYQMSSTGLIQPSITSTPTSSSTTSSSSSGASGDKMDSTLLRVRIRGQAFYLK
jgi:cobalamin biosynthesis Mg chelatase CobN